MYFDSVYQSSAQRIKNPVDVCNKFQVIRVGNDSSCKLATTERPQKMIRQPQAKAHRRPRRANKIDSGVIVASIITTNESHEHITRIRGQSSEHLWLGSLD